MKTDDQRFFIEYSRQARDLQGLRLTGEVPWVLSPHGPFLGGASQRGEGRPGAGAAAGPAPPACLTPWGPTVRQSLFAPGPPPGPSRRVGHRLPITACSGGSAAGPPAGRGSLGPRSPGWRCSPAGRSEAPAGGGGSRADVDPALNEVWAEQAGSPAWAPSPGTQGAPHPDPGRAHTELKKGGQDDGQLTSAQNRLLGGHNQTQARGLQPGLPTLRGGRPFWGGWGVLHPTASPSWGEGGAGAFPLPRSHPPHKPLGSEQDVSVWMPLLPQGPDDPRPRPGPGHTVLYVGW